MIIFPDSNLSAQSQEWGDKVEKEIKKLDKRGWGYIAGDTVSGGGNGTVGPQGPEGPVGPQGLQGDAGSQGLQGEPGVDGTDGVDGVDGVQGIQGEQGVQGDQGIQGIQGEVGSQGSAGTNGTNGANGVDGATGAQGDPGAQGNVGPAGPQGDPGPTGATGSTGSTGAKGDTGQTGSQGAQGLNGFSAYQVAQIDGFSGTEVEWLASLVGATGAAGATGAKGDTGDQGPAGTNGTNGTNGINGATGPAGPGVASGGTAGQLLAKIDGTNYNTEWIDNYTPQIKHVVKLGEAIAKGQAVYVSSADGTNMIVSKASNASEATSSKTLGLLETGGVTNDFVKVVTEGLLAGLDTSTATAGDPVWLGTAGNLIFGLANKPSAPQHLVSIGVVTRVQQNNGEIFVKPQNGFELQEIHDVAIASVANGDLIKYDSATGLWKNTAQSTLAIAPSQVTGTAVITTDTRLSNSRTPTAHASSHASAGSDPVTLAQSQVTNLTTDLAGKAATSHTHTIANVTGLQTALDAKLTKADTGWLTSTVFAASTGWSIQSYSVRKLNSIVNGIINVTRTGSNITVPASGNITNATVATLASGYYNSSASSGMVLTNAGGPLIGGYVSASGEIIITAASGGATISTNDTFSFTIWEMV